MNSWAPHPPPEPPTNCTPRTPRLTRTHAYVNTASGQLQASAELSQAHSYANIALSQSPAADVNNASVTGQKQRAGSGAVTNDDDRSLAEYVGRQSNSSSATMRSNRHTASRTNSVTSTREHTAHGDSTKGSIRPATVMQADNDDEQVLTTSYDVASRQFERPSNNTAKSSRGVSRRPAPSSVQPPAASAARRQEPAAFGEILLRCSPAISRVTDCCCK